MKIAIDISQIVYEGTGVARYVANMVESILKYDKKNDYVFFFSSLRDKLNKEIENAIINKHVLKKYPFPPTMLDFFWNRLHIFSIDTFIGNVDVLITSDWTEPPSRIKKITVVHDLVYLRYPDTLDPQIVAVQKRRLKWVTRESSLIIADSHSTKNDLIELLSIAKEKIKVVYPMVIHPWGESSLTPQDKQLTRPFILTVGKREPRKNIGRLIKAFLKSKLKDIDLVIVGAKGWGSIDTQQAKNIKFLGFVSDQELATLYQSALFFIMPSLYEGFGYPVIEAMLSHCPVAASNTSSLKEIAQGYALLFNPCDENDITDAIIRLANSKTLRDTLKEKAFIHAQNFTGERFMHNLLDVVENKL